MDEETERIEEKSPPDDDAESGDVEDGEPEDGEHEDGEPEDGEPEDGEPEDGDGMEEELTDCVDDNLVPREQDNVLSDDSDSLYALGFDEGGIKPGIKKPLLGFSDKDERAIFPLVDEQSMILFEIVQGLEKDHLQSSEKLLMGFKKAVAVPSNRLAVKTGGPEIKLRIIDPQSREDSIIQRAVAMAAAPDKVPDRIMAAIAKDAFPPEKLALLQEALDKGWKREIVMRSHCSPGKKLGDVYYFSPEGIKFRSSKQVAIFLGKKPELELTIDNFSFAKARVSYNPEQETVRQAYGGKSPMPAKQVVRLQVKKTFESEDSFLGQGEDNLIRGGESDLGIEEGEGKGSAARGSSSRRSIQPPKRYATGESVFYAEKRVKLSGKSHQEREYEEDGSMEMGMLPPKYHKGMEDSNSASMSAGDDPYSDFKRRGRPPKPGGKKDLLAQAEAIKAAKSAAGTYHSEEEGAMFGISAFTQSAHFGHFSDSMGMDYNQHYPQGNDDEMSFDEESEHQKQEGNFSGMDDGLSRDTQELLPCSIRCPGMTGEIPTLQCRRCLCLYHPGCLGLPRNQNYRNFFCSNCEGAPEDNGRHQPIAGNQRARGNEHAMKGMGEQRKSEAKKPPPPLIRANFPKGPMNIKMEPRKILPKMPILQPPSPFGRSGGSSGGIVPIKNRMEMPKLNPPSLKLLKKPEAEGRSTVSVSQIDMRSRRGRPPRNLMIPQLNNRSLTITPISLPRRGMQAPPVPKLQPMMGPRGMIRRPILQNSTPKCALNPPTLGGSSMFGPHVAPKRPLLAYPRPKVPVQQLGARFRLPHRIVSGGARSLTVRQNLTPLTFKRYAQSVVSINQKKYIALPKAKDQMKPLLLAEEVEMGNEVDKSLLGIEFEVNGDGDSSSDDELDGLENFSENDQRTILKNVFSHLELKDLLRCSLVSDSWQTIAFHKDLWDTIILNNIHVTNWEKLRNVILVRETEVLDARGILIEDWKECWDHLSPLFMMRPRKLIVSTEMAEEVVGMEAFKEDNPNCEVVVL